MPEKIKEVIKRVCRRNKAQKKATTRTAESN
jgi:hypothetical protein